MKIIAGMIAIFIFCIPLAIADATTEIIPLEAKIYAGCSQEYYITTTWDGEGKVDVEFELVYQEGISAIFSENPISLSKNKTIIVNVTTSMLLAPGFYTLEFTATHTTEENNNNGGGTKPSYMTGTRSPESDVPPITPVSNDPEPESPPESKPEPESETELESETKVTLPPIKGTSLPILQIAGILTLLILGSIIFIAVWRKKKGQK